MSLKELIRALFKLSGGQAMPAVSAQIMLNNQQSGNYTAPSDGYFSIGCTAGGEIPHVNMWSTVDQSSTGSQEFDARSTIVIRKGDTVTWSNSKVTDFIKFTPTVGGGVS